MQIPRPQESTTFFLLTFVLFLSLNACATQEQGVREKSRLNILLTNDDGYDAIGIQALRDALRAAGHSVSVVAPMAQRSGSSAAINLKPMRFEKIGPQDWVVDGAPASCVFIALQVLLDEKPDLIVSGTNIGNNVGGVVLVSGTVGATMAGLNAHMIGMDGPIPAIAFSADWPVGASEESERFRAHYIDVANFATKLVDSLIIDGELKVRAGSVLNVNYPKNPRNEIRGVVVATQGKSLDYVLEYSIAEQHGDAVLIPKIVDAYSDVPDPKNADVSFFRDGYITITPLDSDYSSGKRLSIKAIDLMQAVQP